MRKLTPKEEAVMNCIRRLHRQNGYAPSVRDLCDAMGYRSTSTVQMYLDRLEDAGYLSRAEGASRSIRLTSLVASGTVRCLRRDALPSSAPQEDDFDGELPFLYQGALREDERLIAVWNETLWWVILQSEALPNGLPRVLLQNGKLSFADGASENTDVIGALLAQIRCL